MEITFRMAARTDVGRVRQNNEDNFQLSSDLAGGTMTWSNNQVCRLGPEGALLAVADGMGGMNAGEVASAIAIDTVRELFGAERLRAVALEDDASVAAFMNGVVVEADRRIKEESARRPETRGMGTTLVLAWLLDGRLHVSWCGDSRAYVFNPVFGLRRLTKDHSYVQELVDAGRVREEDAFDFPDSNIITRCLSDSATPAVPEALATPYRVCDGDVLMLCTDGLCGLLRDEETSRLLAAYTDDMDAAVTALIDGACNAGGHDNVTVCLCQVLSGGGVATAAVPTGKEAGSPMRTPSDGVSTLPPRKSRRWLPFAIAGALLLLLLGAAGAWLLLRPKPVVEPSSQDSTAVQAGEDAGALSQEPTAGETPIDVTPSDVTPPVGTSTPDLLGDIAAGQKPPKGGPSTKDKGKDKGKEGESQDATAKPAEPATTQKTPPTGRGTGGLTPSKPASEIPSEEEAEKHLEEKGSD